MRVFIGALALVVLIGCAVQGAAATDDYEFVAKWGEFGMNDGQFIGPCGIAVDDAGSVYVVDDGNSRIQKFTSSGDFITKWGEYGTADGQFEAPTNIAFDSAGNVYVVDGQNANVQVFDPDGTFLRKWGSKGDAPGSLSAPEGIAIDGAGNVYIADMGNDRVQKFTSQGNFITGWGSDGSMTGQFKNPYGIAVDVIGNVYVADTLNNRVQKFTSNGTFITAWGTEGQGDGQFLQPLDLAIDEAGNVYVTDTSVSYGSRTRNDRVQKFTSTGAFITKWGGYGDGEGQFNEPNGIAIGGDGTVYVVDKNHNRVQTFDPVTINLTQAPTPNPTPTPTPTPISTPTPTPFVTFPPPVYTDGMTYQPVAKWGSKGAAHGQFESPWGIGVDPAGTVYVADSGNNRVQTFDGNGTFLATWGEYGTGDGQFKGPSGIAVDSAGTVWITDSGNNRVQAFDANGTFIAKWGGTRGSALGQFFAPKGIAVDDEGNVFVADQSNNRVQKITPNGTFSAWGTEGSEEGQFWLPLGIEVDASGNVYVADTLNTRVQKFDPDGTFIAAWGTKGEGDGQLSQLRDLEIDGSGALFISDTFNFRVQKFTSTGAFVTKWGEYGTGDGQFGTMNGIAVDGAGSIYVVDEESNRVQKFSLLESVRTEVPVITWQTCLGGSAYDYATDMQPTADGGYVVTGSTMSNDGDVAGNHGESDVWVTKLDPAGGLAWQTCVGGSESDSAQSVQQTSDGGYIVVGRTSSPDGDISWNEGPYDAWLVKLNATGGLVWEKCLGGTEVDEFSAVQQTSDGGYVLTGKTFSNDLDVKGFHAPLSGSCSDGWVVKVDAAGRLVWQSCLGGTSTDEFNAVRQTTDSGYILVGETSSNDGNVSGLHPGVAGSETDDIWLVKLDNAGNLAWQRCLGGTSFESGEDVLQTADDGYVVVGTTSSADGDVAGPHGGDSDAWIVKVDSSGVQGWQGCYEGSAQSIMATSDGGFIISGAFSTTDREIIGYRGEADYWVAMLDAAGAPVWQRCLGGTAQDIAQSVQLGPDGGWVLAGNTWSTDGDITGNHGGQDIWVVKLDMAAPDVAMVPGGSGVPTDTNADGLYNDVNGNRRNDFADVVLYFNQMTWIPANEPTALFDYNGNGRIDFADVVWLFNHL